METKQEHIIDNEVAYPIYDIKVKWTEDGDCHCKGKGCVNCKDLPKGKRANATSSHKIYKEEKSIEELLSETKKWWEKFIIKKDNTVNPSTPEITIEFIRFETWCLDWFCHKTFDTGQLDAEVLNSFHKFVRRMEDLNRKEGEMVPYSDGSISYWQDAYCLMGAEDRWRWRGIIIDDGEGEYDYDDPPPCRCKYCKEQGVIRINH